MTMEIRPFESFGHAEWSWLDAHHHFSFANYYDPERMQVGPLRVWNDDRIQPKTGFDPHSHKDMEIITYVLTGAITHQDSLGNVGRTEAGDIQVMSAGTGIVHAEYNLEEEETTLFQIWILPRTNGLTPRWDKKPFPRDGEAGKLVPMASGEAHVEGALPIDQDATLYAGTLPPGGRLEQVLAPGRQAYLVAARGRFRLNGQEVQARDAVLLRDEEHLIIEPLEETELILADLP